MSKKLRKQPLYIAPEIIGWLDDNNNPIIIDERSGNNLDPRNINDKIAIYERQVNDWFLNPATNLVNYRSRNKGFIILMICLSYLEGIEQYRRGETSEGNSRRFFISALNRIYPNQFSNTQLQSFYSQARCGLFHNGMVQGKIIINNGFSQSLEFIGEMDIKVSPSKFLHDIKEDFSLFIHELRTDIKTQNIFDNMYSNI